uniref:Uncharacterized protein n=1 Tax=Panagrolaimus sp. ES5 TaxID=591445 RepID=A0AC34FSH7_9BILA
MAPYPNQEELRAGFDLSLLLFLGLAFVVLFVAQINFYTPTTFATICEKNVSNMKGTGSRYGAQQNGIHGSDSNYSHEQENDTFDDNFSRKKEEDGKCYEQLAFPLIATFAMLSNIAFAALLGFATFKIYQTAKLLYTTKYELEITDIERANLEKDCKGNLGFKNTLFIFSAFAIFGFIILFASLCCQGFHFYIAKFYLSYPLSLI